MSHSIHCPSCYATHDDPGMAGHGFTSDFGEIKCPCGVTFKFERFVTIQYLVWAAQKESS